MDQPAIRIVVLITTSSREEAEAIAKTLVEERLAACVNIVSGARSIFQWQGAVEEQDEVLMVVKSRNNLLPSLIEAVKRMHSYTLPEVIALPILDGSPEYLAWIDESVR